jgi:hypothetical protein
MLMKRDLPYCGWFSSHRDLGGIVLGAALLALIARPAVADQDPAGCSENDVNVNVSANIEGTHAAYATNGFSTVRYTVTLSNGTNPAACDLSVADFVFHCPGADGNPASQGTDLRNQLPGFGSGDPRVTSGASITLNPIPCSINVTGTFASASVIIDGQLHDLVGSAVNQGSLGCNVPGASSKVLSIPVRQPTPTNTATSTNTNTPTPTPTPTNTPVIPPCSQASLIGANTTACPRRAITFSESSVLIGFRPSGGGGSLDASSTIQAFYSDEHALTLGTGAVSASPSTPGCNTSPSEGTTCPSSCVPVANCTSSKTPAAPGCDPCCRPVGPSIYVTDITGDFSDTSGDWQCGTVPPTPIPLTEVCGQWKAANGSDPTAKNVCPAVGSTGAGLLDPRPPLASSKVETNFCAEAIWNPSLLPGVFQPGHAYRVQFMVHDGDQNNGGGDTGQACVNVDLRGVH